MAKFNAKHWIAIGLTLLATVLLFFAPKLGTVKKPEMAMPSTDFDIRKYIDSVKVKLDAKTQALLLQQQNSYEKAADLALKTTAFDSIVSLWKLNRQPVIAAFYKVEKAKVIETATNYAAAGKECYMASRFVVPNQQKFLFEKAIDSYGQALAIDTANAEYKTSLGICYVESGKEPMKGITMLRDVVKLDSTNIKAQVSLGMFAIQSGQNDKAVKRFKSIIAMDPNVAEAYLYLAEAYSNLGNKKEAIECLNSYKKINTDKTVAEEIDKYINDLKTN